MTRCRVLILGGTAEAAALAAALAERPDIETIVSLAGRTKDPARLPGGVRVGGFGGVTGLTEYLRAERIGLAIDATHPFATQISRHAAIAAGAARVPLLRLERPPWRRDPDDRWIEVATLDAAAAEVPEHGARAFLTVGSSQLQPFGTATGVWFLVRLVEAPAGRLPLADYEVILGRGPFAAAAELRLLDAHRIDVVIAKNSGGEATYGKIAAARALGLPVILLRRPPPPQGGPPRVAAVAEALAWIEARIGTAGG